MAKARAPLKIKLSGRYDLDRFDALVQALGPIMYLRRQRRITFDLAGLAGVNPAALALLTAVLRHADLEGLIHNDSTIEWPKSPPVRNYLIRMDFLKVLMGGDEEAYARVQEPFTRKQQLGFRPCSEFREPAESRAVAVELSNALGESCKTERLAKVSLDIALSELTDNVLHHADATAGGFAAAQTYKRAGEFEIAIVDLGIGIRGSLTKNPTYSGVSSDIEAIQTALKPRVTSTPERNAGIGLFVTRLLLQENGGLFLVRSGKGAVYSGVKNRVKTTDILFPGTLVALRARTKKPLDINRVYAMLDNDDDDSDD